MLIDTTMIDFIKKKISALRQESERGLPDPIARDAYNKALADIEEALRELLKY